MTISHPLLYNAIASRAIKPPNDLITPLWSVVYSLFVVIYQYIHLYLVQFYTSTARCLRRTEIAYTHSYTTTTRCRHTRRHTAHLNLPHESSAQIFWLMATFLYALWLPQQYIQQTSLTYLMCRVCVVSGGVQSSHAICFSRPRIQSVFEQFIVYSANGTRAKWCGDQSSNGLRVL